MRNEMQGFVTLLLGEVRARASAQFSGLGLVFYIPPMRLPVIPLGDESLFQPLLPIRGIEAMARTLAKISALDSAWHDGFHLIDV